MALSELLKKKKEEEARAREAARAEAERDALDETPRRLGLADVPAIGEPNAGHRDDCADQQQQTAEAEQLEAVSFAGSQRLVQDGAGLDARVGRLGSVEDLLEPGVNLATLGRDAEKQAEKRGRDGQDDQRRGDHAD